MNWNYMIFLFNDYDDKNVNANKFLKQTTRKKANSNDYSKFYHSASKIEEKKKRQISRMKRAFELLFRFNFRTILLCVVEENILNSYWSDESIFICKIFESRTIFVWNLENGFRFMKNVVTNISDKVSFFFFFFLALSL